MPELWQDYYDWWLCSEVCVGEPFHVATWECLQVQLSQAGASCILLADLLNRSDGSGETFYALESNPWQPHRDCAAEAAEAVGAIRLAAYFRQPIAEWDEGETIALSDAEILSRLFLSAVPDSTPEATVEPESHRELIQLLEKFARRHETALLADQARHGDRRFSKGFSRRRTLQEREFRCRLASQNLYLQRQLPRMETLLADARVADDRHDPEQQRGFAVMLQREVDRWASYDRAQMSARAQQWFRDAEQYIAAAKGDVRSPGPAPSDEQPSQECSARHPRAAAKDADAGLRIAGNDALRQLENDLKLSLPVEYLRFLESHAIELQELPSQRCAADALFADPIDVLHATRARRRGPFYEAVWPLAYLEIGEDGVGNYYALDTSESPAPVLFFDHEEGEWKVIAASIDQWWLTLAHRSRRMGSS